MQIVYNSSSSKTGYYLRELKEKGPLQRIATGLLII